jgi:hypothetical protein
MTIKTATLSASTGGVDLNFWTKRDTLHQTGITPNRMGFFGDGGLDIPALQYPGLFAIGAPANARKQVLEYVASQRHGSITSGTILDGFLEFLQNLTLKLQDTNISLEEFLFVTDRDGCITQKRRYERGNEFAQVARTMGTENPRLLVLTGSAVYQNRGSGFMQAYGLTPENLGNNKVVRDNPYLMGCENGAILVNVLDHTDTLNLLERLDPSSLEAAITVLRPNVRRRIQEELFDRFSLSGWVDYKEQKDKPRGVHENEKEAGVTFNVPPAIRDTPQGDQYRTAVLDLYEQQCQQLGIKYTRIS